MDYILYHASINSFDVFDEKFINSTGKYQSCGLDKTLLDFENTVEGLYSKISNP